MGFFRKTSEGHFDGTSQPAIAYHPGDVFYSVSPNDKGEDLFVLNKVLLFADGELFVRAYWENETKPDPSNRSQFDLRTSCEPYQKQADGIDVFVLNEPVTEEELEDYQEFARIQQGIRSRVQHMEDLIRGSDELIAANDYAAALALLTEATSFSKFRFATFDKRGFCFLQLGHYSEAVADLEHSLSLFKEGKATLFHCAQAYERSGKSAKAIEKLEALLELEEDYPGAKELLAKLRRDF